MELHKLMMEGTLEDTSHPYYIGIYYNSNSMYYGTDYETKYPLTFHTSFNFKYNKKFGFTTEREYYAYFGRSSTPKYDYEKIEELLKKLYNSDEFKKLSNPELWKAESIKRNGELPVSADINIMVYSEQAERYSHRGNIGLKTDETFLDGLVDALKKDSLADKEYYKHKIAAGIYYYDYSNNVYIGDRYYYLNIGYRNDSNNISEMILVQVSETYTNTLNYLRNNGYASELDNPSFSVDDSDNI